MERKYLAHFLDTSFDSESPTYEVLGKDLEEYVQELNADVEIKKNIRGETSIRINGYEPQSEVDPYYYEYEDALSERLAMIANERLTGDELRTTMVDVCLKKDGTCHWAYREDIVVVPNSIGGDTSGVQVPFTVYNAGNRVKGTFDIKTKKFTPSGETTPSGENS